MRKRKAPYKPEPSFGLLKENLDRNRDKQRMVGGCTHCPEFETTGTVKEVRAAQEAHRRKKHPETFRRTATSKRRSPFSRHVSAEREAEIEEERRRRMKELGIDEPASE